MSLPRGRTERSGQFAAVEKDGAPLRTRQCAFHHDPSRSPLLFRHPRVATGSVRRHGRFTNALRSSETTRESRWCCSISEFQSITTAVGNSAKKASCRASWALELRPRVRCSHPRCMNDTTRPGPWPCCVGLSREFVYLYVCSRGSRGIKTSPKTPRPAAFYLLGLLHRHRSVWRRDRPRCKNPIKHQNPIGLMQHAIHYDAYLSTGNDFAVRAVVARAHDTARAYRLACAIGHGRRARHPDSGSRATLRSRAHQ